MSQSPEFEILLVTAPGLEAALAEEAREKGFARPRPVPGGVVVHGKWPEVWRANLELRGAARVLARIGEFRAMHLAQLDKRARKFEWNRFLRHDVPVSVEATCTKSRIYHGGAAAQRVATAIRETLCVTVSDDAALMLKVRIDDDMVTLSIDTSGEPLHKRGHKEEVGKAPLRENLAAMFLRQCGYTGTEPVVDPMCGSGTFVIEAAEIALGHNPGRSRNFAFEQLAGFDARAWNTMRQKNNAANSAIRFYGFDRDQGAIRMSSANAERAGVASLTQFRCQPLSALAPPEGPPGLVMVNPPYGERLGDKRQLEALYATLGKVLSERFQGWRAGIITSEPSLARATGLSFEPPAKPVQHGGLKVTLYRTGILP